MLQSSAKMLRAARENRYAVGQFNINNLIFCREILLAAQECKAPVILGVTQAACGFMAGTKTVSAMAHAMCEELRISVPVSLHLDHASLEGAYAAIDAGFSSVMYDGSREPLEINLANTAELVRRARSRGVSVEAELGAPAGTEEGAASSNGELASPEECRLLAQTGISSLAAGIGNCHGEYPESWAGLDFGLLERINAATGGLPLVLHGGSGIPEDMIRRAVQSGVAKINVNTECQASFTAGIRRYIEEGMDLLPQGNRIAKLSAYGCQALRETVKDKIHLFASAGTA